MRALLLVTSSATYLIGAMAVCAQDISVNEVLRQNSLDQAFVNSVIPSNIYFGDVFIQSLGNDSSLPADYIKQDMQLGVSCVNAFAFSQRITMACKSALEVVTYVEFYIPQLRAEVVTAGSFSFTCVHRSCIKISSDNGRLAATDRFDLNMNSAYTNSIISILQGYRELVPLQCNPYENIC